MEKEDVEKILVSIGDKYNELVKTFVPKRKFKQNRKLLFMRNDTKSLLSKSEKLYRTHNLTKRDIDFDKYEVARNKANAAIKRDKM